MAGSQRNEPTQSRVYSFHEETGSNIQLKTSIYSIYVCTSNVIPLHVVYHNPYPKPKTKPQVSQKVKANYEIEGEENSLGRMISHRRRSLIPARSLHTTRLIVNFLFMLHERTAGAEIRRCAIAAPGALDTEAFADFAAFEHQWDPLGAQVGRKEVDAALYGCVYW